MEDLTLVIMAAGMGSRFGGAKQVEPVDMDGNFILDYSIYDAMKAGFNKVVFIIKEEDKEVFESTIGKRLEGKIDVEYAFQKIDDIPVKLDISKRKKPWGTLQAVLSARKHVNSKFLVINADDFYGENSYKGAADFLKHVNEPYNYATISYAFNDSVWGNETTKRGVLMLDGDIVTDIKESKVTLNGDKANCEPLNGSEPFEIEANHPVSMNMFAFSQDVFPLMEDALNEYFNQDEESIFNGEALLPDFLMENIKNGKVTLKSIESNSVWLGMTYREDLEQVKAKIEDMKKDNIYPTHLWS